MMTITRHFRTLSCLLLLGALAAACSRPGSGADPTDAPPGEQMAATTPIASDGQSSDEPADTDPNDPQQAQLQQPGAGSLLPHTRVISYYGHPSTPTMGVLGSGTMEEVYARLQQQVAEWQAVDPNTPIKPAFEIIATVAQPEPGPEGTYLLYTGDEWIGEYVDFATAHTMLVILDLQIGHNSIENEINRVRHWLALPNVHVALDPEFSTKANDIPRPDRVPGELIGEISGYQVMTAVEMLSQIVAENNIPNKILIVHQFEEEMIYEKHVVETRPGVDIVVDVDGFGAPETKIGGYQEYVTNELIQYGGLKLFYEQDVPLLDPATMLTLNPPPSVVIYQ